MKKIASAIFALPMLLLASMAQAQTAGTITFTANKTSATGSLTPVLTWSTTPTASSCTASGAWSGTKFASGSETLPAITSNKSYTLTCSWGNGTATVRWTAPTKNTDGSSLTDLSGYKVVYGTSSSNLNQSKTVSGKSTTSTSIGSLGVGTWYFAVRAVNAQNAESANSNVRSKTITAATASKTVNITVSAAPAPTPSPSLKTTVGRVYDVVDDGKTRRIGKEVGTIPLGKPCDASYKVTSTYFGVNKSDAKLTKTPQSTRVIAKCESR